MDILLWFTVLYKGEEVIRMGNEDKRKMIKIRWTIERVRVA